MYLAKSKAVMFTVVVLARSRSTLIFNAIMIPALIPLSLRGVTFRPEQPEKTFTRSMLIYDLGGVDLPFIGIKAIDLLLALR